MSEVTERINRLCARITSAETLNALHACRPGHPWNKTVEKPFSNAYSLVALRSYALADCARDVEWLQRQAARENES